MMLILLTPHTNLGKEVVSAFSYKHSDISRPLLFHSFKNRVPLRHMTSKSFVFYCPHYHHLVTALLTKSVDYHSAWISMLTASTIRLPKSSTPCSPIAFTCNTFTPDPSICHLLTCYILNWMKTFTDTKVKICMLPLTLWHVQFKINTILNHNINVKHTENSDSFLKTTSMIFLEICAKSPCWAIQYGLDKDSWIMRRKSHHL